MDADQTAWELARTQPMTIAGLVALLAYVKEREDRDDNDAWPQLPPDGDVASWSCVLHRNLAKAIEAIMVRA